MTYAKQIKEEKLKDSERENKKARTSNYVYN